MLKRKNNLLILLILLFVECKSQKYQIQQYFNQLKDQAYSDCMSNDFTLYSLEKDSSSINKLKEDCRVHGIIYNRMKEGVTALINSLQVKDAKKDFVVINTITSDLTVPAPVISILKVKDKEELFVIKTDAEGKKIKASYKIVSQNDDFLLEKKKDILSIENYLFNGIKNNVTDIINGNIKSHGYHVVARVNGKYIIKELYCTAL